MPRKVLTHVPEGRGDPKERMKPKVIAEAVKAALVEFGAETEKPATTLLVDQIYANEFLKEGKAVVDMAAEAGLDVGNINIYTLDGFGGMVMLVADDTILYMDKPL